MSVDDTVYLNEMTRDQMTNVLEAFGFAVYDHETDEELREAIRVNLDDGTISEDDLI